MIFSNIGSDDIKIIKEFRKNKVLYVEVETINRGCVCKRCGTFHTNIKEYRNRKIKHSMYSLEKTVILLRQRRFICPKCGKTHMEINPFSSESNRISDKTIEVILKYLKRYNITFRAAGNYSNASVGEVIRLFDKYCKMERKEFTRVLCFDEIYFSRKRKKKYVLVIINFFNKNIVDVLRDRDKSTINSYLRKINLEERKRVEHVCIDMTATYRDILKLCFPLATISVDSFHVVKYIQSYLDKVKKRILKRYENDKESEEYYLLKFKSELLTQTDILSDKFTKVKYRSHYKQDYSEYSLLIKMLNINPELKDAYELYHSYIRFNNTDYADPVKAMDDLEEIINQYKLSNVDEFIELSSTLDNWKNEIVNSFIKIDGKRISNGPIEGKNSLIKKILRLANGYTNFRRFRNRIMYSLNKDSTHTFKSSCSEL